MKKSCDILYNIKIKGDRRMIGYMRLKKDVCCDVCGHRYIRDIKEPIRDRTEESKNKAKEILIKKVNKKYVCKTCKSILKDGEI